MKTSVNVRALQRLLHYPRDMSFTIVLAIGSAVIWLPYAAIFLQDREFPLKPDLALLIASALLGAPLTIARISKQLIALWNNSLGKAVFAGYAIVAYYVCQARANTILRLMLQTDPKQFENAQTIITYVILSDLFFMVLLLAFVVFVIARFVFRAVIIEAFHEFLAELGIVACCISIMGLLSNYAISLHANEFYGYLPENIMLWSSFQKNEKSLLAFGDGDFLIEMFCNNLPRDAKVAFLSSEHSPGDQVIVAIEKKVIRPEDHFHYIYRNAACENSQDPKNKKYVYYRTKALGLINSP